ncbi:Lon protease [Bifidobacterium aemilianum]|uniref:endopeptidase La n=2 Tax=Bifidobacterium aemilianum TaxID=2493120 RepID=A0A366KD46_9BIFI|nr:Lon protease [Bifidobacterium aemilianum]
MALADTRSTEAALPVGGPFPSGDVKGDESGPATVAPGGGQVPARGKVSSLFAYVRGHSLPYLTGLVCLLLSAVVLLLPSAYVVESAGPTQDVLGESKSRDVISLTGARSHKDSGKLLLLTVNAAGTPDYPVPNMAALLAWLDPHQQITPSEAVFPVGQSSEEYTREARGQMSSSQKAASKAALAYASKELGLDTAHVKVSLHLEDIGGPSAGMMYSLGIIDMLTPQEESGGRTIAGTGTIDPKGKVGAIGGIQLKMLGAKRDGASWFLAPKANCKEVVGHVPSGLRDVEVSNLDEAYRSLVAIGQGKGEGLPHCTQS